jgi:predicted RND superfamily exporter protein
MRPLVRGSILAGLGLCALVAGPLIGGLRFDHNTRSLLREDARADDDEAALVSSFGSEDVMLVAWEVGSALNPDEFERLRQVTRELAAVEGLEETYSLASDIVRLPLDGKLRAIAPEDLVGADGRERVKAALLAATPYVGTIYSDELDVVAVAATLKPGPRAARERAVEEVRAIAAAHDRPGRPVHVAGVTALAMEATRYAVEDMVRIGGLALGVSILVLLVLCRSVTETVIAIAATALPPLYALACAVALDVPVTALGAALFPVMGVVGITGSVHLLSAYAEERRQGVAAPDAAVRSARRLAPPVVLSFLTTAAGFASLSATGVPAFRGGGHIVALGMLFAVPVLLLGLPAALSWLQPTPHDRPTRLPLPRMAAWALAWRGPVAFLAVLLCAGGLALLPGAKLRVDVLQAFEPHTTVARTYAFLEERLTATIPVDAVLTARPDAPPQDVLRDLERFSSRARAAGVDNAMSLATLVEFGRRASPVEVGDTGALLFLRTFFSPITKRFEDVGTRRYRVKMRVRDGTPPSLLDRLAEAARGTETGPMELTGLYVRAVGTTRQLVRDFTRGALLMAGLVLLTLALALRSWRVGLAAVLPNLVPPAVVFGAAALLGATLDVSAVAVGAVSIGLAVDNTLHVAFRIARERRGGATLDDAIVTAERSVGRALVFSTVVLAAGLLCLAFSAFLPTARFGIFAGAATLVALPGDLAVFPALIRLLKAL